MPTGPISFGPNQQSGLDPLSSTIQLAVNVVLDQTGAVKRRPGISTYEEAPVGPVDPDGVDGIYVTVGGKVYLAGGSAPTRKLYRLIGGVAVNLSGSSQGELVGDGVPDWAETEAMMVVAARGAPQKILLATDESSRLGGSPPFCSHVIANNSRLLVNNILSDLTKISFSSGAEGSSIIGHETWIAGDEEGNDAGSYFPGSRPDPVVSLHENGNEVLAFCSTYMQTHAPSEVDAYATASSIEAGCSAPYSCVRVDERYGFLDHKRRFVMSDGRQFEIVSGPIQRTLDEIETVSDCFGFRLVLGITNIVLWTFPSDGRSFAFFPDHGGWAQWTGWNETAATFGKLGVNCAAAHPLTGQNVLGMADGRVAVLDHLAQTDLGESIPVRAFTGFIDRGTDGIKHCLSIRLVFRRGIVTEGPEPTAILSWRDDEDEWSPGIEVGLGDPGDRNPVVVLRSLGTYRRRQWRIDYDGLSEFTLAGATEEFEQEEE